MVLLAGEPGIGKSHALQQLAAAARASSATVLTGRCVEGTWVPPFRPFAEAIAGYGESVGPERLAADLGPAAAVLARIAPRLPELLPDLAPPPALQPDAERFRLLDAAAQFFTALSGRAAVLLILDDLHWADAGTAMMMRHVARSCTHRRLLIAGAYRTTEMVTEDPLADVLGALQAETECSTIPLRALGTEAVGQLVAAEAGTPVSPSLAAAIAVHTGGNPFFAKEMIRHLMEERALDEGGSGVLAKDGAPGRWRPIFRWWRCPKECGRSWPAAARGCRPRRIGWRSAHPGSLGRSSSRLPPRPRASTTPPRCPRWTSCSPRQ